MPTYRKLHTKIIDSYDFAEMPDDFTRVFWMLLIVVVDSEGRAIDNPAWLRSKMFPLRSDIKDEQIESAMSWLASRQMIVRYSVGGRRYFYVVSFKTYQSNTEREAKSVLPAPQKIEITHDEVMSKSGEGQELPGPGVVVVVNASESVNASVSVKSEEVENDEPERPNVYAVYEKEIGQLTPTIADQIDLAEKDYPPEWVEDAIKTASLANHRSWRYVEGILRNWQTDGKGPTPQRKGQEPKASQAIGVDLPFTGVVEAHT